MAADLFSANVPPGRLSLSISMLSCFIFRCRWEFASTLFDKKVPACRHFSTKEKGALKLNDSVDTATVAVYFHNRHNISSCLMWPISARILFIIPELYDINPLCEKEFFCFCHHFQTTPTAIFTRKSLFEFHLSSSSIIFAKKNCA